MSKKIRKAIIPAAGLGTRFLPATKAQPKEMLPIVDKPTIQYIIEEAVASGIEEILIITGRSKKCIEDHFDKSVELELELEKSGKEEMLKMVRDISDMVDIHFIRQKEPKGLGHAISCAKTFLGRYIITPRIFKILEETKPGKGGEIQLTDALLNLISEEAMYAYDFEGTRYDVGDKLGFLKATVEYALRREDLRDGFIEYLNTLKK